MVQEVLLAPKSKLVFPSGSELHWSDIVEFAKWIDSHDPNPLWKRSDASRRKLCDYLVPFKRAAPRQWFELITLRDNVYRILRATGAEQSEIRGMLAPKASVAGPDIVDVLLAVRNRHCTDPRDKIYGILSLVQSWDDIKPIKVDYSNYSKDIHQGFTDIALKMLQSERYGVKTLLLAHGLKPVSSAIGGSDVPTWVPDWTCRVSEYYHYQFTTDENKERTQLPLILDSKTLLLPHVILLGKITFVTVSTPHFPLHHNDTVQS